MGSQFVSTRYGFGNDKWIQDMVRERRGRGGKAEEPETTQQAKPVRDTLELSSRQPQQPGLVQFAPPQPIPVPILVSGLDYTV